MAGSDGVNARYIVNSPYCGTDFYNMRNFTYFASGNLITNPNPNADPTNFNKCKMM